jgi:probable F420-dependent oxidoreductase
MTLKVDVQLSDSVINAARRARELEALGVDGAFSFENSHDLFLPLAAAAPACSLDLFTNVAIAFPRSPMHLAYTAYDLQELSEGRFRLGLGSQIRAHVENRFGATWDSPVAKMREWVLAIRAILESWQNRTRLQYEGKFTRHTLMTPAFDPGPNRFGLPPILVGALGPRMNEVAAEVADGILVMPFNSAQHMEERTVPAILRGLGTSGRSRNELEITVEVIVGVGRSDRELERARRVRGLLGFYGSTPGYKAVLDTHGWGDVQPELNRLSKQGNWRGMQTLISDEMLHTLAVLGTPEECAAEIINRYGRWADRVCIYFPGYEVSDVLVSELTAAIHEASSSCATDGDRLHARRGLLL